MAQIPYRGNLSSAGYSFNIKDAGRSVILPQLDQNFNRQIQSTADSDRDIGIPQVMYLRNVFPTERGYRSFTGRNDVAVNTLANVGYSLGTYKGQQVMVVGSGGWISTPDQQIAPALTSGVNGAECFMYELNGATYSMKRGAETGNLDKYYKTTGEFFPDTTVALSFPLASITGTTSITHMCVVGNRLVFVVKKPSGEQIIAWSSANSPDDFDFSRGSLTGAGFITPQHIDSAVLKIVPHFLGAIIYTKNTAVAMVFQSGDAINPFTFRPVPGIVPGDFFNVVGNYRSPYHYFISFDKCMRITMQGAEPVFSALDTLLREKKFVTVNSSLGITEHSHDTLLCPTVNKVCDRYVVFCFVSAVHNTVYACIYDELLKRWGQCEILAEGFTNTTAGIKIRTAIAMPVPGSDDQFNIFCLTEITSSSFRIRKVTFSFSGEYGGPAQQGILSLAVFGKFQHSRNHLLSLQLVEMDNTLSGTPTVKVHTYLDGKNVARSIEYYNADKPNTVCRLGDSTGISHSVAIEGSFDLNTLQLLFSDEGRSMGISA